MSKISYYPSADEPLQLSDRLIGTEAPRIPASPTPLATKNFSLGELLQLFSSNFPAATLQAVLDAGNTATQNITLVGTIDTTLIRPDNIEDTSGSQGLPFQFLSKGASSINWGYLPVDNLQAVLNAGNTATQNITLIGNITSTRIIPGNIQDDTTGIGTTGQFLSKTASGIRWVNAPTTTTPGLGDVLSVNNTAINNINLTGNVTATSFIKTGGTNLQYLMADGSVTTGGGTPTLQQVVTQGNTINDNKIDFYESTNYMGSIGGSQSFLEFNNQTLGGLKYLLDAYAAFSISLQDNSQYSVLNTTEIVFYETNIVSTFGLNGFQKIDVPTTKSLSVNFPTTIVGTNKTQTFQDASGTIALLSDIPSGGVTSVTATSPITSSGGTTPDISTSMATNKLIGRSTAGTGVMEEITVGTGLTLSGGTLNASATGGIPHATASGTDTYTATVTGVTSYADGDAYLIRFTNGNTTGATLNINSLGAIPLYRNNDGVLIGGDIISGGEMLCVYNSTTNRFQVIGTAPNSLFAYVTNDDSVTLTKGMPVYAFGGTGDRMTVKRAYNTGDATSAQTVGLVLSTSIAANQKGLIMMQGLLDGLSILPTATWSDGDPVYLGATAGTITNVKPYAPNHLVYLGVVTTASNGAAGRMYVRVQNGYELQELHNVQAQSPSLKDTLWYDNTVSPAQWKTASISTVLGFTPENVANKENTTLDTSTTKYPTNRLTKEYADAKVTDAITNGVTTIAPSQNAVFDALALKADAYPNYPFNTTTNYFGLFDIVTPISSSVVIGSTANNTNSAVAFNRFSVDKEITISDFAILQNAANDGASATVTLYIFDDTNAGLPGVKLHQETTATGILTPAQKYIAFTNNITLQKGNYWVALHFRGLNAAGTNPSFIGGLVNQPNVVTSIATYGINFRPLITGATADLSNNPTITLGAVQNLPQIFIKI